MPAIGRGLITEQSFTGALRRVRVRLAHLAATRQVAPPLPFGEEGLLLDAVLPADSTPLGREVWVQLRGWHVLRPPASRLMVLETDSGLRAPLRLVRLLVDRLSASATLVAFVETKEAASALRRTLKTRLREAGLSDVEVRFQYHDSASQTIREDYSSIWQFRVGLERRLNDTWAIRGGYHFDNTPVPAISVTPLLPDQDRHGFALGGSWTGGRLRLDAGAWYLHLSPRSSEGLNRDHYNGTYDNSAVTFGLSLGYSF